MKSNSIRINRKIIITVCIIVFTAITFLGFISRVNANDSRSLKHKYFTNITVESGDSIWSIAKEYMDYDFYDDINDYMNEICKMNNLSSDRLLPGDNLIITYYAEAPKLPE